MNNDILIEYIDMFKDYLSLRNKSQRTISEYGYDLYMFNNFLDEKGLLNKIQSINDINERMIEKFIIYLRNERKNSAGEPLSPTTIKRKFFAICSFFKFLIRKKYFIGENPTKYIDMITTTTLSTHTYLSIEQAQQLMSNINTKYKERDTLIIGLMLLMGLRVSEVAKLNIGDIDSSNKTITIHGKGNKERTIPYSTEIEKYILDYLACREKMTSLIDKNALFISRNHRRITVRRIQKLTAELVNQLGFNIGKENEPSRKKITCHKLRHTFGTLSVQNGVDILTLKDILGHSTINTTQIYAKASNAQIRNAIENNPVYNRNIVNE